MLGIYCRTSREVETEISTISQQEKAGIKFAVQNNFEYDIYKDEGKSGYKISDDDLNPFKNRPCFTNLINDIKNGKIDKIWVWEISRLSRNDYASAFIFNVFEKHKTKLYVKDKEYELVNPEIKLNRVILGAIAEYERHLIVSRTTRGIRKRIDEGKRVHQKLYCYRKDGKDDNGYVKWVPVESEVENYKHILKRFNEGATLRKITFEIYDKHKIDVWGLPSYAHFIGRILRGYQYTGFQLTIEGNEIYKKFRNNEIENLQVLLDKKYWIKSIPYPLELISIEDWVKVCEALQIRGRKLNKVRKERILRASKDIATGIIQCGDCNNRFYYKEQRITNNKGRNWIYTTYFHHQFFNHQVCSQKPKSFYVKYINEIFKVFYFFFMLVFDNKNEQTQESLRSIKLTQLKLKDRIAKVEKEIPSVESNIDRFKRRLKRKIDDDIFDILLRQISESEKELGELNIELSKLKIDYELQTEKFNQVELEMTYYDVKDKINDWFLKLNVEEQRNELIRVIECCKIFKHHLIIDTGKIVFLFDIKQHYVFDMGLLEKLNRDEIYKEYFVGFKGKYKAKLFNDKRIPDIDLNKDKEIRLRVFEYLIQEYEIYYDLTKKTNLVSFVPLRGLFSIELETAD